MGSPCEPESLWFNDIDGVWTWSLYSPAAYKYFTCPIFNASTNEHLKKSHVLTMTDNLDPDIKAGRESTSGLTATMAPMPHKFSDHPNMDRRCQTHRQALMNRKAASTGADNFQTTTKIDGIEPPRQALQHTLNSLIPIAPGSSHPSSSHPNAEYEMVDGSSTLVHDLPERQPHLYRGASSTVISNDTPCSSPRSSLHIAVDALRVSDVFLMDSNVRVSQRPNFPEVTMDMERLSTLPSTDGTAGEGNDAAASWATSRPLRTSTEPSEGGEKPRTADMPLGPKDVRLMSPLLTMQGMAPGDW